MTDALPMGDNFASIKVIGIGGGVATHGCGHRPRLGLRGMVHDHGTAFEKPPFR